MLLYIHTCLDETAINAKYVDFEMDFKQQVAAKNLKLIYYIPSSKIKTSLDS